MSSKKIKIATSLIYSVVRDLLDSSSSSSDEEIVEAVENDQKNHDAFVRYEAFVQEVVYNYSDEEFKNNFHVERKTVEVIVELYMNSGCFVERRSGGILQTSAETHILVFLWFCAHKSTTKELSKLFSICFATVHKLILSVIDFLVQIVAPKKIAFPESLEQKNLIANKFEKATGFPNVLGCIDTSYISVRTPAWKNNSTSAKGYNEIITFQGICDSDLRFNDVYIGVSSKIFDSDIYNKSPISKNLSTICGTDFHILGDLNYPLREYLLTPYPNNEIFFDADKEFNINFCQSHVKIKNAFDMLKGRFQQLNRLDFIKEDTMVKFILACCTLHNLCIDNNDFWYYYDEKIEASWEYDDGNEIIKQREKLNIVLRKLGIIKRNKIKGIFENYKIESNK